MRLGLNGKRALVTGGSSGIGRACAAELAREGAFVHLVARDVGPLQQAVGLITSEGGHATYSSADLSSRRGAESAYDHARTAMGGVDILVNSAGDAGRGHVLALSDDAILEPFRLKAMGYLHLAQLVAPEMQERGWGRIINIAGGGGASPSAENIPISLANVAVLNLTRALSDAVAADGVLVNVVCPGVIDTPRGRSLFGDSDPTLEAAGRSLPAGRVGQPEEVANVVCFLASEACSYVHGSSIYMDGGRRRGIP